MSDAIPISDKLVLVPVLELEPGAFSSASPPAGPWGEPEQSRHWTQCLASAGIMNLPAIEPASWFVPLVDAVNHPEAGTIIARAMLDSPMDDLNAVAPLMGGYALTDGGKVLLSPRCCGDLGDRRNWHAAVEDRTQEPRQLWVGHPELEVWHDGEDMYINDVPVDAHLRTVSYRVRREALLRSMAAADKLVLSVLNRLADVCPPALSRSQRKKLARNLVGEP